MSDPASAAALMAAGPIGSIYQNYENRRAARRANAFSAKESALNRDFQERMSSSAFSRAHDDLISAGFNPLLALSNPGSTPSGAQAVGGYATAENPFAAFSESATNALSLKKIRAEVAHLNQETATSRATEALVDHQIRNVDENSAFKHAETMRVLDKADKEHVMSTPYRHLNSILKYIESDPTSAVSNVKHILKKFFEALPSRSKSPTVPIRGSHRPSGTLNHGRSSIGFPYSKRYQHPNK